MPAFKPKIEDEFPIRKGKPAVKKNNMDTLVPFAEMSADNPLPLISAPRCKICNSPYRIHVDMMVARGYSYRSISEYLKKIGDDISYKSVERHAKAHLDLDSSAYRAIMEKHIEEYESIQAEHDMRVIGGHAYLDLFIQKGWDELLYGDFHIEPRDVIRAVEVRETMMERGMSVLEEKMINEVKSIILAIKEIVPEYGEQIAKRAKELSMGMAITESLTGGPKEIVEGKVEEIDRFIRQGDYSDTEDRDPSPVEVQRYESDGGYIPTDG